MVSNKKPTEPDPPSPEEDRIGVSDADRQTGTPRFRQGPREREPR